MLDFSEEIRKLFASDNVSPETHKRLKLIFYKNTLDALYPRETLYPEEDLYPRDRNTEEDIWLVIENDRIVSESLVITESLSESENLEFGSCNSAMLEIVVANIEEDIIGKEFELVVGIGEYEITFGLYTVKSFVRQSERKKKKITAYDRMVRFNADVAGWYEAETFPMTLKEFRKSLCTFIGIQEQRNIVLVNDDLIVEKTLNPESLLGIDVLRRICQINGVFGNIGKDGNLRYISIPKKNDVQDEITVYKLVESEEYTVPNIDTVKIQKEEGDIGGASTGGDDINTYIVEGNFLVYGKTTSQMIEVANNILSKISDLEYRPSKIEINGSPWHEIGDRIRAKTSDGDVETIITRRTSKGIQKFMDTIESTGSQELTRTFNIRTQITEAKGLTAILKRTVEEVSNDLTDLEKETNSKFTQTASLIALKVSKGDVTSQLNSELKITGNSIDLTTGHFTINAKNLTLDASGNARFSGSINVNDMFTVDSSGKVIAKSIEVSGMTQNSTLACQTLVCTGGMTSSTFTSSYADINEIDAGAIYANDVYARIHDTSDRRLKKDINHINTDIAIKIIKKLNPVSFTYKDGNVPGMGFIAQEVKEICDEYNVDLPLYEINRGRYLISYANFIPIITSAIQEVIRRLDKSEDSYLST